MGTSSDKEIRMVAVIFRAKIQFLDEDYQIMAAKMRQLAFDRYGCLDFYAVTEGDQEVAVSYWPSHEHVKAWHADSEHKQAQRLGRNRWYKEYSVEVTEVVRQYRAEPKF
ncbi:antibiotic biosynthesis monooxygenase family protein [Neptunomonas phycophila]|uniref:antibiotic biosynthesis monooxygenase family protein n=1 Tax=Neptunomonas phycophila TaxID=1572645 RepID=UPI001FF05F32|nr:antibiotic biosynthesis monooxygenase [Neptunomonas phycophila]